MGDPKPSYSERSAFQSKFRFMSLGFHPNSEVIVGRSPQFWQHPDDLIYHHSFLSGAFFLRILFVSDLRNGDKDTRVQLVVVVFIFIILP